MAAFDNFIGGFYLDSTPHVDCEEAINVYLEKVQSGESRNKTSFVLKRSPGLRVNVSMGLGLPIRCMQILNGTMFAVVDANVYDFNWDGANLTANVAYGPIATDTRRAAFAADPARTQLAVYSAQHVYLIEAGAIAEITWPGVPISWLAGPLNEYFLFLSQLGDGFFYSEPGDANTGDPLNFRSAEAGAYKYIGMVVDHQQVWLFSNGPLSQVFYNDTGDGEEPFKPNPSAVIPRGTISGDSVISINGRIYWIGDDQIAYTNDGYTPKRISTHAVEATWNAYGDISDALSFDVTFNGHHCWRVWFPSADMTWEYDTEIPDIGWRKVPSWDEELGKFIANRGFSACFGFGKQWIGDRSLGEISVLDPTFYFETGALIRVPWVRTAPIINNEGKRIDFPWFELDINSGAGLGGVPEDNPESDPAILISYSNNWGRTFEAEMQRSMGQGGDYKHRCYVARCGSARYRVFKVRGSAAVPVSISNAYIDNPEGLDS